MCPVINMANIFWCRFASSQSTCIFNNHGVWEYVNLERSVNYLLFLKCFLFSGLNGIKLSGKELEKMELLH